MKKCKYYAFLLVILSTPSLISAIFAETKYGSVIGKMVVEKRMMMTEFLGIPYAEPPIGELRFSKPKPVQPWTKVLDATKPSPACVQNSSNPFPFVDQEPGNSEDCLYLNIFVPSIDLEKSKEKKVVIFWIHGAEYAYGSNRMTIYNARTLASVGDVIVVTINYRLGILGFLSTPLKEAPGNAAIYDILLSLEWVNENIEYFGGNPDAITIAGQSAGAFMSGYSTTSQMFNGLYSRIIMQSGSPSDTNIFDLRSSRDFSNQVAIDVGCANETSTLENDPKNVINCLRHIDALKLVFFTKLALKKAGLLYLHPQYGDEILPQEPRKSMLRGDFRNVDVLTGCMKDDGTIMPVIAAPHLFGVFGEKPFNVTKEFATSLLSMTFRMFPDYQTIIDYYLSGFEENDFYGIRANLSLAVADYLLFCPAVYTAERFSDEGNNVYFYLFTYRSSKLPFAPWMEVTHFGDLEYVFGMPVRFPRKYREEDVRFSWEIIKIWTNFAKYGKPDTKFVSWPTYRRNKDVYLTLNPKGYDIRKGLHSVNCDFWRRYLQ